MLAPGYTSDHERIRAVFGRTLFIHLTRQKKLEQAISYVKASQTGLWHKSSNGHELERTSAAQDPTYDAEAILRHLAELSDMDERWNSWFTKEDLSPLQIQYEDLSDDPIAVTGGLLEYLGLQKELVVGLELPVVRLADATNRQWAERFRADNSS